MHAGSLSAKGGREGKGGWKQREVNQNLWQFRLGVVVPDRPETGGHSQLNCGTLFPCLQFKVKHSWHWVTLACRLSFHLRARARSERGLEHVPTARPQC